VSSKNLQKIKKNMILGNALNLICNRSIKFKSPQAFGLRGFFCFFISLAGRYKLPCEIGLLTLASKSNFCKILLSQNLEDVWPKSQRRKTMKTSINKAVLIPGLAGMLLCFAAIAIAQTTTYENLKLELLENAIAAKTDSIKKYESIAQKNTAVEYVPIGPSGWVGNQVRKTPNETAKKALAKKEAFSKEKAELKKELRAIKNQRFMTYVKESLKGFRDITKYKIKY
jgi:hypothetical protein